MVRRGVMSWPSRGRHEAMFCRGGKRSLQWTGQTSGYRGRARDPRADRGCFFPSPSPRCLPVCVSDGNLRVTARSLVLMDVTDRADRLWCLAPRERCSTLTAQSPAASRPMPDDCWWCVEKLFAHGPRRFCHGPPLFT